VIVDRSLPIEPGKTVVAKVNGEFLIRKLIRIQNKLFLSNGIDADFEINPHLEVVTEFFGVVTTVLHVPN
jgi:SOS-response transcriptional repressor LexA